MNPLTSPMNPVAPPAKKIKAGGETSKVDDATAKISTRRSELEVLRKQQARSSAKSHVPRSAPTGGPPPPPVGRAPIGRARGSDIFPSVTNKVPASSRSSFPPPGRASAPQRTRQGSTPNQNVVRRLDFVDGKSPAAASSVKESAASVVPAGSRSKSAPPRRPPPPPPKPPVAQEAPASTPSRSFQSRPLTATPETMSLNLNPTPRKDAKTPPPSRSTGKAPPSAPPTDPLLSIPVERQNPKAPPSMPGPPIMKQQNPKGTIETSTLTSTTAQPITSGPQNPRKIEIPAFHEMKPSPIALKGTVEASSPLVEKNVLPPIAQISPVSRSNRATAIDETTPNTNSDPTLVSLGDGNLPPPKSRHDLIRNLHNAADTPTSKGGPELSMNSQESSLLRLEKEVREHQRTKADALRKVALLEEQLQKMKERGDPQEQLQALVQIANQDGDASALQWARNKVSGTTPKASKQGFFSPLSPGLATPRANQRKRAPTPHPKRGMRDGRPMIMEGTPEDKELCRQAVLSCPHEFETELATFIVRRPYGIANETGLWFSSGHQNVNLYAREADVRKETSLEVVAKINADGSTLTLFGETSVRHASDDSDGKEYENVAGLGQELGSVLYIDSDANEKEYSLDDVFEQSISSRANYCTAVKAMVEALVAQPQTKVESKAEPERVPSEGQRPETFEIGVGTEDLPQPDPTTEASGSNTEHVDMPQQDPQKQMPPIDLDDGPDTVTMLVGTIAALIWWLLHSFFVVLPLKILSFALFSFILLVVVASISLQMHEDGARLLGADMDTMFNRNGIL